MRQGFEESPHCLSAARAHSVAEQLADVASGEVDGPAMVGGSVLDEPIEAREVVAELAVEDGGGGGDGPDLFGVGEVGGSAHPHGVDEGQAREVVPLFAEVELVGIAERAAVGSTTLSPMRRRVSGHSEEGTVGWALGTEEEEEEGEEEGRGQAGSGAVRGTDLDPFAGVEVDDVGAQP